MTRHFCMKERFSLTARSLWASSLRILMSDFPAPSAERAFIVKGFVVTLGLAWAVVRSRA